MIIVTLNFFQIISIGLFGIVFGLFETITNLFYLITDNYHLPRLQHRRELPTDADDVVVLHKMIQMLIFGILLLMISLISIFIAPQLFIVGAVLIFLNGLIDYAKFQKKNMFIVWSTITIFCIVSLILFN